MSMIMSHFHVHYCDLSLAPVIKVQRLVDLADRDFFRALLCC